MSNIEEKLDKIIATSKDLVETNREYLGILRELLTELVPKKKVIPKDINEAINSLVESIKKDNINKRLYPLREVDNFTPKKITEEEFIERIKNINWSKDITNKLSSLSEPLAPKIKILLRDISGKNIEVEGTITEDGSVICEPIKEDITVVDWSLKE